MIMNAPVLNPDEIKRIHNDSIRILEEVGVRIPSEKALGILENGGAKIDWDNQIAYISENMVNTALETAPKKFVLGARNPEHNLWLPAARTVLNMDGCGSNVLDFKTGKRRLGTLQDLADVGKVFDAIPSAKVMWSCVQPSDVENASAAGIISTATSLIHTCKHVQDEIQREEELPYIIEILKAILGGSEEDIIERKIYSATYCTVAPLCHDKEMLEGTMALTKYKAPVLMYPMPACGSTGPASLYSNIAIANAESLSSVVIYQLTTPGTPLIYGSALGRIDLKSGAFLEGAVETELMMAGMVQMGKFYGLPTMAAGCLSDANKPGMQAAMEKVMTTIPLTLNEVDIVQGIGLIEGSMTASLEQMIIDAEIFERAMRMHQGIDVCDEKDYFEDIKAVAQGGHFLKQKSTRKAFRTDEFYNTKLIPGDSYDTWKENGSLDMYEYAHSKVEKILASDALYPLEPATEKLVREIIAEAAAKL